jgi:hypothetical protein
MAKTHVFKFPFSNLVFVGTIQNKAANGPGSTLYANTSTGYGNQGSVLVVSSVTSGGNNIIYTPPTAPIVATAMVAGLTYIIQTLGTTNYLLCGSPSNSPGQAFTATVAGIGTGTVLLSMDSLLLNAPGVPAGVHIVGCDGTGTPGGASNYYLDNVTPIYIPNATSMTEGRHFRNQVSAMASFPESVTEGIQTVVINQFSADTGSVASAYVQGSVDGGQNWVAVSSALALTTAAPANTWQSSVSATYEAYDTLRILNGTVTGLASVGGTLRALNMFTR